jgi:cytochrome b subunit of formate dehydrogenase
VDDNVFKKSAHGGSSCIECHTDFDAENLPHKKKIEPVDCQTCHDDVSTKHPFHKSVVSKGKDKNQDCKQCHGFHNIESPKTPGSKFHRNNQVAACGSCHTAEQSLYLGSKHGKEFLKANKLAPTCLGCHAKNIAFTVDTVSAATLRKLQEEVCINCHIEVAKSVPSGVSSEFIKKYEASVHGKALIAGNAKVATCIDCHGKHENVQISDPSSPMNKLNVSMTCGKCHRAIEKEFNASIHGTTSKKGVHESPVCTSCHGEHDVQGPKDPNSRVSKLHVSADVCTPCHNSLQLNSKYGIASDRIPSYDDSFHGLANKGGSTDVANCASCHGVHNIKPSSDSTSLISKKNLPTTCGKCHPGANQRFGEGKVHVLPLDSHNELLYLISNIYIGLILVTIGGMFVHNTFDFYRKGKRLLKIRRGLIEEEHVGHSLYVRMTLEERLQHFFLLTSFITLVITGFMVRFPDAFYAVWIRSVIPTFFDIRSLVHRIAAVVIIAASLYHCYYLFFTPRGKQLLKDLLPKIDDVYDAIAMMKYNLGIAKHKPELDRFSYIEKAEYWALIWGTVVMGVTGVILWADNYFLGLIGKPMWDVARTIHYFEAILAALAIVVWHFYFVMFNPDTYPMNLAWLFGTITEKEMLEEHPKELTRIKQKKLHGEDISEYIDKSHENDQ